MIPPALKPLMNSVIEARLSNGLKLRLLPSTAVPTISYYTFFDVGSRNEMPGITGISHLFEHMMFNGAKKYGPGEFDRTLESNGGSSNAYTSNDMTVYYQDFMAEAFETVVDLESDRMRSLAVTPKMLKSEREVVIEERRLRVDNEIAGMLDEELNSLVWKAHPYRWPVIGWMKDIESISREDCLKYFQTYYAPNNATIYIAGDFSPPEAIKLVKKYYGNIRAGAAKPPPVIDAEPEQKGERRSFVEYPAQSSTLMIAWRAPAAKAEDTLVLDVLQYILSVGQSSRLVRSLVYEQEVCVGVSIDFSWRKDPGVFVAAMELKSGADPKVAESALYAEIQKIATHGVTEREVQKAKNNLSAQMLRELSTNSGRAHALGHYEALLGSWKAAFELHSRYEQITAAQVQAAAMKYLRDSFRSVVTLVPTEKGNA